MSFLERNLREAEQTISVLRAQMVTLEATLAQFQQHDPKEGGYRTSRPKEIRIQNGTSPPCLPHAQNARTWEGLGKEEFGAWETLATAATETCASDNWIEIEVDNLISLPTMSLTAPTPPNHLFEFMPDSPAGPAADINLIPSTSIQDPLLAPVLSCCSDGSWAALIQSVDITSQIAVVESQKTSVPRSEDVFQPAVGVSNQINACDEPTMLCSEAYILIAQQNCKGVNQGDIAAWLWSAFRKPLHAGNGCRVNTNVLLCLLAFIGEI